MYVVPKCEIIALYTVKQVSLPVTCPQSNAPSRGHLPPWLRPGGKAALFYSPVDFTDASDLHQTVVKFIGESIDSIGVEDRCTKLLPIATIHWVNQRSSEQQSYDMPMYNK